MIRGVSHNSLFLNCPSTTLKVFNPAGAVLFSVTCSTVTYANLKCKDVLPRAKAEAIAGNLGARKFSGSSLLSSRRWRYMYSEVAGHGGPDVSSVATGTEGTSKDFEFNSFQEARDGFKADLFREQTQELRKEILSGNFEVKPTPYTPINGTEGIQFYVICMLLFVAFWVGNYLAPDLIFKNTVFRKGSAEDEDQDFAEDVEQVVENQQRQGPGLVRNVDSTTHSQTAKVVGFGNAAAQTTKKPRRS